MGGSLLRGTNLIDHCTQSISYDRQVQAACTAFDKQMAEIIDVTDGVPSVPPIGDQPERPAALPAIIFIPLILELADENLIDILAWQFHVDFYDHTKPLEFRKRLVQNSILWHMRKGTVALLQEVLDTFWPGGALITEWFEYSDPFPPNYPIDDEDRLAGTFTPPNVNIATDTITLNAHGLINADMIRFEIIQDALAPQPPAPLLTGLWYRVRDATANTFKVSVSLGGAPVDLTTAGNGTIYVYERGTGSWHDRYRFRVIIDETIILPEDEAQVLALINAYKPVSRWLEGIFRMQGGDCLIGWYGACLQFLYIESEPPDYP